MGMGLVCKGRYMSCSRGGLVEGVGGLGGGGGGLVEGVGRGGRGMT